MPPKKEEAVKPETTPTTTTTPPAPTQELTPLEAVEARGPLVEWEKRPTRVRARVAHTGELVNGQTLDPTMYVVANGDKVDAYPAQKFLALYAPVAQAAPAGPFVFDVVDSAVVPEHLTKNGTPDTALMNAFAVAEQAAGRKVVIPGVRVGMKR